MITHRRIAAVVLCLIMFCAGLQAQKISSQLQDKIYTHKNEPIDIIVSLKSRINQHQFTQHGRIKRRQVVKTLKDNADISAKTARSFLARKGIENIVWLWATNSFACKANPFVIDELAAMTEVESIRYDLSLQIPVSPAYSSAPSESNLNLINAPAMWNLGFTGQGVVVAVLDSGADIYHPDISSKWRGGSNSWFDPHNHTTVPYDIDGHGTGATGIIVGGSTGGTAIGASPDAQWIAAKIFNDSGSASFSKIHQCLQWLLDPDGDPNTDDSPDIANNSWGILNGTNQCIAEFQQDINLLNAMDIVVVFAAGNEGPNPATSISPANYSNVISVGAVYSSKVIAGFSSRGPSPCYQGVFPTIIAPGVNIKTADLTGGGAFPLSYAYVSGTSFAAPHIAAAAALLKNAFPDANAAQIEQAIIFSAEDLGDVGADYNYGYGLVNVFAAYEYLKSEFCYADLNLDGYISLADIEVMAGQWLIYPCTDCISDLNSDQTVNMKDFAHFSRQFAIPGCR